MYKLQRAVMVVVLSLAGAAFACSPSGVLVGEQELSATSTIPTRGDSSADKTAPARVVIDDVEVRKNGGPCGNTDVMVIHVTASDDVTAAGSLRYAVSFGGTAEAATAATPELLFDATSATEISLQLIDTGARFAGTPKCFTLSAVDDAANVGAKSEARCVDTSKPTSGCSSAPVLLLPLGLLLARRRRSRS